MTVLLHDCPACGCQQRIRTTLLMCPHHWFRVPAELRLEVHAAWRGYQRGNVTIDELRIVQARAIASVNPPTETRRPTDDTVKGGAA